MANDSININIPLKFDVKSPPLAVAEYDPKALSDTQQRELNDYKSRLRKANHIYLTNHPEIQALMSMVIRKTAIHHPRNVIEFVSNLFTRPESQIRKEVKEILNECKIECEEVSFSEDENWDY